MGGLTFSYGAVSIGIADGYSSFGPGDQYLVGFAAGPTALSIRMTDFSEALFTGDALPLTPPSLTGLFTEFFFQDTVAGTQVDVNGASPHWCALTDANYPLRSPRPSGSL